MQNPLFFDARPALCAAQALAGGERVTFSQAVFATLWSGGFKPDHPGWVEEIMERHGLPAAWARPKADTALMRQLLHSTETACRAGAFGAPTFVLHGAGRPQLFWGVDRMDFLARAIEGVNREQ
jgi:2-hydroxychromene-2-carboxylate isomerase